MCIIQDTEHKTKATKCAVHVNKSKSAMLSKSQFTDNIINVESVIII